MKEDSTKIDPSDDFTLKNLIELVKEYFHEVLQRWKLIILVSLVFGLFSLVYNFFQPKTYTSNLTFMLNEEDSKSGGVLGTIFSSLGGGGGGDYNLEKLLALLKSRNIIQKAMFEKGEMDGKEDYYANHLINEYNYHERWEDSDNLEIRGFLFDNNKITDFKRVENGVLKAIFRLIVGGEEPGILDSKINETTGILNMSLTTIREDLSIDFVQVLYEKLEKFYVEKTVEKQKKTYEIVTYKLDSIRQLLNSTQLNLLKHTDSQRNILFNEYRYKEITLQREIQALSIVYGETLKNQEIADFSLKSKTPFVQIIDRPIAPLRPSKDLFLYIKWAIISGILGVFLATSYIIGRKILFEALN